MSRDNEPEISVVMPCYNCERYLEEAVRSVLAQGAEKIQIIVVDDGSADDSARVSRSIDERVECISQPNTGVSGARNAGISRAKGKYLAFLDADDIWTPGSLTLRLEKLHHGNECVFGGVQNFLSPELSETDRERFGSQMPAMTGRLPGSMLIERRAFDRVGLFDATLEIGEMFDWVARAEVAGITTVLIDQLVLRRRIHGNNISIRLKHDNTAYLKVLRSSLQRKREAAPGSGGVA